MSFFSSPPSDHSLVHDHHTIEIAMGNTLPQITSTRSAPASATTTTTNTAATDSQYPMIKKSRSLRDYARSTSTTSNGSTRSKIPLPRPRSMAPTDAEIIDMYALRCEVPAQENELPSSDKTKHDDHHLMKQLDYIHSCVRKDKGLFGR